MEHDQPCRVLVMDDGPDLQQQVRDSLACAAGRFEIVGAGTGTEALLCAAAARAEGRPYALIFAAPGPPPARPGLKTLTQLREENPMLEVIVCGDGSDSWEDLAAKLLSSDRCLFLKKPLEAGAARQLALFLAQKWSAACHDRLELEQSKALLAAAEKALRAAQEDYRLLFDSKMESVGQLASGIAHDFNNLLTVISGHAGMLMAGPAASAKAADSLKEIAAATKRASDLTRQLMTFSRKHELHLQVADLNEVVSNVGKMLRRILGEDISLRVDFAPGLPSLKADLGMLEQVLMSLAVNSRDAMPKGGQLLIRTSAEKIDEAQARLNPEAAPGLFVCLTFSDTGCGIAPDNLGRIFEPFFTTKQLGHGTGLGLATVYGIVKQHQGWIQVSSRLHEGATFQVFFPAWHEKSVPLMMPSGEQKVIGGAETILLVEDEAPLLKLMHHILEGYGYKVLDCSTGKAALEIWREHEKKIDLLLSDLILPDGMSGQELANLLQAEKPGLKVIYTCGYDSGRLAGDFAPAPGAVFIQKPFHARKLAETVFDTLRKSQQGLPSGPGSASAPAA
jgi:signal transduction histidine kinase/ActR/RegA family two-component response regulator